MKEAEKEHNWPDGHTCYDCITCSVPYLGDEEQGNCYACYLAECDEAPVTAWKVTEFTPEAPYGPPVWTHSIILRGREVAERFALAQARRVTGAYYCVGIKLLFTRGVQVGELK